METSNPVWQGSLSESAIKEFQKIWRKEFKEKLSAEEARARAKRLLELYTLLYSLTPKEADLVRRVEALTDTQFRALLFIDYALTEDQRSPPVREVAQAIGCRSSRTAFRAIQELISLKFLRRRKDGVLVIGTN